ncbi:TPA: hypothetical protein ACTN0E_003140, partial [Legionella pneumophila]|uniref:hypothetical protein n=2 Tax=Legionella pneumophila TaxID=446 RepID=UPI0019801EF3
TPCRFLAEKIWIINESVSYFNEFRPLDCFVATLLATTVPKIVPYREHPVFLIATPSTIIYNTQPSGIITRIHALSRNYLECLAKP